MLVLSQPEFFFITASFLINILLSLLVFVIFQTSALESSPSRNLLWLVQWELTVPPRRPYFLLLIPLNSFALSSFPTEQWLSLGQGPGLCFAYLSPDPSSVTQVDMLLWSGMGD